MIWIALAIVFSIIEVVHFGVTVLSATVLFSGGVIFVLNVLYINRVLKVKKILQEIDAFNPSNKDSGCDCNGCSNCQ